MKKVDFRVIKCPSPSTFNKSADLDLCKNEFIKFSIGNVLKAFVFEKAKSVRCQVPFKIYRDLYIKNTGVQISPFPEHAPCHTIVTSLWGDRFSNYHVFKLILARRKAL